MATNNSFDKHSLFAFVISVLNAFWDNVKIKLCLVEDFPCSSAFLFAYVYTQTEGGTRPVHVIYTLTAINNVKDISCDGG